MEGKKLAIVGCFLGCTLVACSNNRVCDSSDSCPRNMVCHVGRCSRETKPPVKETTQRILVSASKLKVYTRDRTSEDAIHLAYIGSGESTIVLEFIVPIAGGLVRQSNLTLYPVVGVSPCSSVEASLYEVGYDVDWARNSPKPPEVHGPSLQEAMLRFSPPQVARIDVTSVLKHHKANEKLTLVLKTRAEEGEGLRYASGVDGEQGPQLDIYAK
jgi:hypothetical protein